MRLIILFILAALTACQARNWVGVIPGLVAPGHLRGHVSIGPLTPAERAGVPTPTVSPQAYAARTIVVLKPDAKTEITRIKPDAQGNYQVTLAPGEYVVDMARVGIDRARGLPTTVTITSGMTTTLNIAVDTGIR
jgi:hypothetical protein